MKLLTLIIILCASASVIAAVIGILYKLNEDRNKENFKSYKPKIKARKFKPGKNYKFVTAPVAAHPIQ